MTLRVGRFKHKTLTGYYYLRSLNYASLANFHKNLLACRSNSVRGLSNLDQERLSLHPALLGRDPSLWGWNEKYPTTHTSTYRDLIAQFSKALNVTENDCESANSTFIPFSSKTTLSKSSDSVKYTPVSAVKHDTCNTDVIKSRARVGNIDRYAVSDKDNVWNVSQTALKSEADVHDSSGRGNEKKERADHTDLLKVKDYYINMMPQFYKSNEDTSQGLHHVDIVLENNFFEKQKILKGLDKYLNEQSKLRIIATFKFASYFFSTVGATTHVEESCVKVHWRFHYITNFEWISSYLWKRLKGIPVLDCYNFHDGISTFFVNKDGVIVKHQIDRLMPIQRGDPAYLRPRVNSKLASVFGLAAPTPQTKFKKKTEPQG